MKRLKVAIFLLLIATLAKAQPNDNCNTPTIIPIANFNYGTGIYPTAPVSITAATVQPGEFFHPVQVAAGNIQKSLWYKFTLPTRRSVKIELKQVGNVIPQADVGFTTYKSSTCMPGIVQADNALITALNKFGSSYHPCLDPGEYLIQVSGKLSAAGLIFLDLDVNYTAVTNNFDLPTQPLALGLLAPTPSGVGSFTSVFPMGCQSLNDSTEFSTIFGPTYKEYSQSIWITFTTGAVINWMNGIIRHPASFGNDTMAYRLYQGNATTYPNALTLLQGPTFLDRLGGTQDTLKYFKEHCFLQPNTTYSIQLLFHQDFRTGLFSEFTLDYSGFNTKSPRPNLPQMDPSSIGGILSFSNGGATVLWQDGFGCNSLLNLPANNCGNVNPPAGVVTVAGVDYQMAAWYTFQLNNLVDLQFTVTGVDSSNSVFRLFRNEPTSCGSVSVADLVGEFTSGRRFNCLEPGFYSVQALGRTNPNLVVGNLALGRSFSVGLTSFTALDTSKYDLKGPWAIFSANNLSPLIPNLPYFLERDTFSCRATVLPDSIYYPSGVGNPLAGPALDRGSYRMFNIGDGDGDNQPDSGYVIIAKRPSSYPTFFQAYKGNIQNLAIAQNAYNNPQTITGLSRLTNNFILNGSTRDFFCVTPGDYSIGTFVNNNHLRQPAIFDSVRFQKDPQPLHPTFATAQNMGDITNNVITYSDTDYFACRNNPLTIAGITPCGNRTKLSYRYFYLNTAVKLDIRALQIGFGGPPLAFALFAGHPSNPAGLVPYVNGDGPWNCVANKASSGCILVDAGWYTIVTYGQGPSFQSPVFSNGSIGNIQNPHYLSIQTLPIIDTPKFNRPYKAFVANDSMPTDYLPNYGTSVLPKNGAFYSLGPEIFGCILDTPWTTHPLNPCDPIATRVAYFVFELTKKSYVLIHNLKVDRTPFSAAVYPIDVRVDSALLPTIAPVQPCLEPPGPGQAMPISLGLDRIQLCDLPPGFYTLVVNARQLVPGTGITPILYVDSVSEGRFDYALNAYDFDLIPADSTFYTGKVGDVHPTVPGRPASHDFLSCLVGASPSDPSTVCSGTIEPNIYNPGYNLLDTANFSNQFTIPKRNLWYTFVAEGPGLVTARVNTHRPWRLNRFSDTVQTANFHIYQSDVDGTLDFNQVRTLGELDSTLSQGLTLMASNNDSLCNNLPEVSFIIDECGQPIKRRFYIVVETSIADTNDINGYKTLWPNSQVDVAIKFDPKPLDTTLYDHFSTANFINGLNQIQGPYTDIPINIDTTYYGDKDFFTCATRVPTDENQLGTRTLWYKFRAGRSGNLLVGADLDGTNIPGFSIQNEYILFKEIIPGDSSAIGLIPIKGVFNGYDSLADSWGEVTRYGRTWAYTCLDEGIYYLMATGYNRVRESIVPVIRLETSRGDYCFDPVAGSLNGFGNLSMSTIIDCHTIGEGFGENGSNMNCLFGPLGYKSTWFRIDKTDTAKVDMTFQILPNTTAPNSQIRFRVLYGSCNAMTPGPCNSNALTQFTLNCMQVGAYYVQVVSPINAVGTIGLSVTTTPTADPNCNPIFPDRPISQFTYIADCLSDTVQFINNSTAGPVISYLWDFGYNGATDTTFSPYFIYPISGVSDTFSVRLIVFNNENNTSDTSIQDVIVFRSLNQILGPDTTLCAGDSLFLDVTYQNAIYLWNDSTTLPQKTISQAGLYWVNVSNLFCDVRDTLILDIQPYPTPILTSPIIYCFGDTVAVNAGSGNAQFTFNWFNNTTDSIVLLTNPGLYTVDVSWNGCGITDSTLLVADTLNEVSLGLDTTICFNTTITLEAFQQGATYIWNTGDTTSSIIVDTAGIFSVQVSKGVCVKSDTIQVFHNPLPIFNLGPDSLLCSGDSLIIGFTNQTPGAFYNWSTNATTSSIVVRTSGSYQLTLTDSNGCVYRDTIVLDFGAPIILDLGLDTTICDQDTLTLDATIAGATFYLWNTGDTTEQIQVFTAGVYSVEVRRDGCEAFDSLELFIQPLPLIDLGNDQLLCEGDTTNLSSPITPNTATYLWSTGSTAQNIIITNPDTVVLTVSEFGCSINDTVIIEYQLKQPMILGPDTILCVGTPYPLSFNVPGATYLWNTGDTIDPLLPTLSGIYGAVVQYGVCFASDSVQIRFDPPIEIYPFEDTVMCIGDTIFLNAGYIQGATYLWSTGDTTQILMVTEEGNYSVIVENACGIDNAGLFIDEKDCDLTVHIPNAFTPNNDNKNNVFVPIFSSTDDVFDYDLKIFNRWGEMVFRTNDPTEGWDGDFKGQEAQIGVYSYVMYFKSFRKTPRIIHGTVSLIR